MKGERKWHLGKGGRIQRTYASEIHSKEVCHQFGSTGGSKRLVKSPEFRVDTVRVNSPLICTLLFNERV